MQVFYFKHFDVPGVFNGIIKCCTALGSACSRTPIVGMATDLNRVGTLIINETCNFLAILWGKRPTDHASGNVEMYFTFRHNVLSRPL